MADEALQAVLMVQWDASTRMETDRLRLLEAIRNQGSISAAARTVDLSCKAAWDAVNAMNNLFDQRLVAASPGGAGGDASVAPAGHQVVDAFIILQAELSHFPSILESRFAQADVSNAASILWSLFMRTSARNMFRCTVTEVIESPVDAEVLMDLTDGQHLSAIITERSIKDLDLAPGKEVFALVKSTFVILTPENGFHKTSARNRLCGTVTVYEEGTISSEIVLDLGDGKTIAALITKKSADFLDLKPGDRVCALIKASHIILAME